ncbi:MAG: AsmA family protein [Candidatus Acidiferrales bacterium]
MRRRRGWLAALMLLAAVLALPFLLNLNLFRTPVRRALERHLGRPVEMASLTARLLPRPALVAGGVVVGEEKEFGAEPFLFAQAVECRLALRSLWRFHWQFSELHFVRPSVNLVRNPGHAWNVGTFLLARAPGNPGLVEMPLLSAEEARLNVKLGADKQPYALVASRLRLEPLGPGGWRVTARATPVRTDRRLSEIGEIEVEGEVRPAREISALPFEFRLSLERGSLAQLWTLASGREPPWRAEASLAATLTGTPEEWAARGTLALENLRRWDLVASSRSPRWTSDFDLVQLRDSPLLMLKALTVHGEQTEVAVSGSVANLFGRPQWDLEVRSDRLAWDPLLAQLGSFREGVPSDARFDGTGQLSLLLRGPLEKWQGEFTAPEPVALTVPGLSSAVRFEGFQIRLARRRLELLPLTVRFSSSNKLVLGGRLDLLAPARPFRLRWQSDGVHMEALERTAAVFGWNLFGRAQWRGSARLSLEWAGALSSEEPPQWQGEARLQEASYHTPELNDPISVPEAHLVWKGPRLEIRPLVARLGEDTVTAALEHQGRTGRWNLVAEGKRLDLKALDELFNPARRSLLSRFIGSQSSQDPGWRRVDAAGTVSFGELVAGPFRLREFGAKLDWQSGWFELSQLRFRAQGGQFEGRAQADYRTSPPRYRLGGHVKQIQLGSLLSETTRLGELYSGILSADLTLETAGTRPSEFLRQLHGRVVGVVQNGAIVPVNLVEAMAAASDVGADEGATAGPTALQSLAGEFLVGDEQVQLDGARLTTSRAALELAGTVGFDGRLDLRLRGDPLRVAGPAASPKTLRALSFSYRLTGTLREPRVEATGPAR